MRLSVLSLACLVGLLPVSFLPVKAHATPKPALDIPFTQYVLDNGLQVILHTDPHLPMVAVNVWYHVGPVNEPPQRSGFAHLFEHLMFEGSKYAQDRFDILLESVGGTNMNGTTSWDRTNYYETVPSEHLELALWLEADRMGFMIDTLTQEKLDLQREVVKNERRQSYENQPYGPSNLALYDALFPVGHPYHGAVIGSMQDLSRATLQDVQAFFQQYYSPSNATLVLAGNFEAARARAFIDKYFGTLPKRSDMNGRAQATAGAAPGAKPLPAPQLPARIEVKEDVALPQVVFAWTTPPAYSATEPALDLALRILGTGKSSRLYQALVVPGIANLVGATLDANQVTSITEVVARAATGHTSQELEALLLQQLQGFAQVGPTAAELARAKTAVRLETASDLQRLNSHGGEGGRAGTLQRFNHYLGDPGALKQWAARYDAVTAEEVRAAVASALSPTRVVIVSTLPTPQSPASQSPTPQGPTLQLPAPQLPSGATPAAPAASAPAVAPAPTTNAPHSGVSQ